MADSEPSISVIAQMFCVCFSVLVLARHRVTLLKGVDCYFCTESRITVKERDVRSKPLIIHAPLSVMMSFFGRKWSWFPWTQCVENEHCNVIM